MKQTLVGLLVVSQTFLCIIMLRWDFFILFIYFLDDLMSNRLISLRLTPLCRVFSLSGVFYFYFSSYVFKKKKMLFTFLNVFVQLLVSSLF